MAVDTPSPAKRKRRRPAGERSGEILTVALELFARRDYNGVTIRDIARACGINVSLIYYYFGSKAELYRASIEHAIRLAMDRYRRLRREHGRLADPLGALEAWFDVNLELAGPLRQFAKVIVDYRFSTLKIASIDRLIERLYAAERAIIAESVREGVRRGLFRKVDPATTAAFVSTHLDGIFFGSMTRASADLAAGLEALRRLLWDYLGCAKPDRRRR